MIVTLGVRFFNIDSGIKASKGTTKNVNLSVWFLIENWWGVWYDNCAMNSMDEKIEQERKSRISHIIDELQSTLEETSLDEDILEGKNAIL